MQRNELPLGFAMALAKNESALHAFEAMSESQKEAAIRKTHSVNSKREMENFVRSLTQQTD